MRTKRSCGDALFSAGDAQPAGAGLGRGRGADGERMAVGVTFDDREQLRIGRSQAFEKAIVVLEGLDADLSPAGSHDHGYPTLSLSRRGLDHERKAKATTVSPASSNPLSKSASNR